MIMLNQPHICLSPTPHVHCSIHLQVKAAIKRGSNAKRTIAAFFFALSGAYIRARRVKNGVDLKWAVQPRPIVALAWALLTVAILAPLHRQAPTPFPRPPSLPPILAVADLLKKGLSRRHSQLLPSHSHSSSPATCI